MTCLELLAPARNKQIGIAAIDCGADAVYIGGPAFGARHAACNSLEDIAELCSYAHRFGARIFLTVNTLPSGEEELACAMEIMVSAQEVGVDAFIVQDPRLMRLPAISIPIHASTQCSIRSVGTALYYQALGASRLVLEREMDLDTIKSISDATDCEIEFFVHGALCVCYSGQCYLSEALCGRSANRGECIQACRSLYDLVDENGRTIVRNKALLSLRDYNLLGRLDELAAAGVSSFKIEGRLKNISYVRNTVRQYSMALDGLIGRHPGEYRRASWGRVTSGFSPDVSKSFNRGFTELYLDGKRGCWSSMDAPKSTGEYVGTVIRMRPLGSDCVSISLKTVSPQLHFNNGDGFSAVTSEGMAGFRADVVRGTVLRARTAEALKPGTRIYRNLDLDFERTMESNPCIRRIPVRIKASYSPRSLTVTALSEDGRTAEISLPFGENGGVRDRERFMATLRGQLSKRHLHYYVESVELACPESVNPEFLTLSRINAIRRDLMEQLDSKQVISIALAKGRPSQDIPETGFIPHTMGTELMRSRYCIRYEIGMCLREHPDYTGRLYLLNNGRRFPLGFDCAKCEMTVGLK